MQRILLVEDDSSIVRSLTAFLAEEGFSAASAPRRTPRAGAFV